MAEHKQMIDYSAHQELIYFISQSVIIIPTEHTLFTTYIMCHASLVYTSSLKSPFQLFLHSSLHHPNNFSSDCC